MYFIHYIYAMVRNKGVFGIACADRWLFDVVAYLVLCYNTTNKYETRTESITHYSERSELMIKYHIYWLKDIVYIKAISSFQNWR